MSLFPAVDVKELVRSKTDLVALIGETLTLQPRHGGRLYVGLCPFHDDHNPSFNVNPERQTYRCWVCQEGGDCFSYLMKYENIGFREALVALAERAGVELPKYEGSREDRTSADDKGELYAALLWVEGEFRRALEGSEGARARGYLKDRHFTGETLGRFRLGYAPDSWDWLLNRANGKFAREVLARAGVASIRENSRSGMIDTFRDRVMFPIHDERGRVISFGGRILPDSPYQNTGKYINGTDTPVFHKSKVIFGFSQARDAIRKSGTAVVTEGYVDCIKAHQAGVLNAVGTLGTALTESHVALLKRSARRVVLVYDGDKAGKEAAVRAIEKFLGQDVDLRILTLPDELDPDEFLDQHGVTAFEALIEQAPEAWEFQLQHSLRVHGDSVDGRAQALDELLRLLDVVPGLAGTSREQLLVARISQRLLVREELTRRRLQDLRAGRNTAPRRKLPAGETTVAADLTARKEAIERLQRAPRKDDLLETEILQLLFTAPHLVARIQREVGVDDFRNEPTRELLATCFDVWEHGDEPEFSRVLARLECPLLKGLAVWIDEQAAARNLTQQLADSAARGSEHDLLAGDLQQLTWRREVVRQEALKSQRAEQLDKAPGLTPDLRDLLTRQTNFHKQRQQKPTSTTQ